MNTIILVSVLSTLGVVAIVAAIVVTFIKLNKRVDDGRKLTLEMNKETYNYIDHINKDIIQEFENKGRDLDERFKDVYSDFDRFKQEYDRRLDDIYRFVDSRCDKLDDKISGKHRKGLSTERQILKD